MVPLNLCHDKIISFNSSKVTTLCSNSVNIKMFGTDKVDRLPRCKGLNGFVVWNVP